MIGWIKQAIENGKNYKDVSRRASLFFNDEMGLETLKFDLFISEDNSIDFKISDHPLQNGCKISDHVTQELRDVTIEGMFTTHPIYEKERNSTVKIDDDNLHVWATMENTALANYKRLEELAMRKEPVRLVTSLVTYPKMIISGIKSKRDERSGESVRFTMRLREVVTVTLKKIQDSYVYNPESMKLETDKIVAPSSNSGRKPADEKASDELRETLRPEVMQ